MKGSHEREFLVLDVEELTGRRLARRRVDLVDCAGRSSPVLCTRVISLSAQIELCMSDREQTDLMVQDEHDVSAPSKCSTQLGIDVLSTSKSVREDEQWPFSGGSWRREEWG